MRPICDGRYRKTGLETATNGWPPAARIVGSAKFLFYSRKNEQEDADVVNDEEKRGGKGEGTREHRKRYAGNNGRRTGTRKAGSPDGKPRKLALGNSPEVRTNAILCLPCLPGLPFLAKVTVPASLQTDCLELRRIKSILSSEKVICLMYSSLCSCMPRDSNAAIAIARERYFRSAFEAISSNFEEFQRYCC